MVMTLRTHKLLRVYGASLVLIRPCSFGFIYPKIHLSYMRMRGDCNKKKVRVVKWQTLKGNHIFTDVIKHYVFS
jgi:hypothetical protein